METVVAVSTDWRNARLDPADHAMLEFSEKLTATPGSVTERDLAGLRQQGFSDREILSITLAAAYRNFITRVADGLGVELRRDGAYVSEILHAFGVREAEVKTTIYGDRQTAREGKPLAARSQPVMVDASRTNFEGVCGIDTTVANKALFEGPCQEMIRLTKPHAMQNLAQAFSLRPDALTATLDFGRLLGMGSSGLGRRLEAIIGLAVATTAGLPYLVMHHAQTLLDAGATSGELELLVKDPAGAALTGQEGEVFRYCEKLTREPGSMARSDLEALRKAGFNDSELVTIAASASFENFLGRAAAGVLVRLERDLTTPALRPFSAPSA